MTHIRQKTQNNRIAKGGRGIKAVALIYFAIHKNTINDQLYLFQTAKEGHRPPTASQKDLEGKTRSVLSYKSLLVPATRHPYLPFVMQRHALSWKVMEGHEKVILRHGKS